MNFLNAKDIIRLTDTDELRKTMARALVSVSAGETTTLLRNVTSFDSNNALGIMPAFNEKLQLAGYKAVSVYPDNNQLNLNPHQGMMVLQDFKTGVIKCLLEASFMTALRTAAVSALAVDVLSRKESSVLTIVGAGLQAHENILSVMRIRDIKEIKIANRTYKNAVDLKEKISRMSKVKITIESDVRKAVKKADIIIACTSSGTPVFDSRDLKPGAHVSAIGSCRPGHREVNLNSLENLSIFVDNFEACSAEAEELSELKGKINSHTTELGQVLDGIRYGRQSAEEITFFKSVGIGACDLFAADYYYQKALLC